MKLPWVSRKQYDTLSKAFVELHEASEQFLREYMEFKKQYERFIDTEPPKAPRPFTLIKGGKK